MNDTQNTWDVGHSVAAGDFALTKPYVAGRAIDNQGRRVRRGWRRESVVRWRGVHVDIPEGECGTHLACIHRSAVVFVYCSQQTDFPAKDLFSLPGEMDDALRILVAEALRART